MIKKLVLQRFRNLPDLEVAFGAGCTLLVGATGAGKTSLLEALYLVSTTKSFRASRLEDCLQLSETREAAPGFLVSAEVDRGSRLRLDLGWTRERGLWRQINGEAVRAAQYLEVQPALAWSTVESETLIGPPALRRRLLDRGLVGLRPSVLTLLAQYRRALEHKRRLLLDPRPEAGSLEAFDRLLAESGCEISKRRRRYVTQLQEAMRLVLERTGLPWPPIELCYQPSTTKTLDDAEAWIEEIARRRNDECRLRRPLVGPHLDRFEVLWRGHAVRRMASAGERKLIGLVLLSAQAELLREGGREPILLLDDLDAELDRPSLEAISRVFERLAQWVVSSNRPEVFDRFSIDHRWKIDSGQTERL